jgi:hypothetical protein
MKSFRVGVIALAITVTGAPLACAQRVAGEGYVLDHVGSQHATIMQGELWSRVSSAHSVVYCPIMPPSSCSRM